MPQQITLSETQKTATYGSLTVSLGNIVIEEIEADPNDKETYPAGSGINIHLSLESHGKKGQAFLNDLSKPYESVKETSWEGYRLALVSVQHPGTARAQVTLRVEELSAQSKQLTRQEMVEFAKKSVVKNFGQINFDDFPNVRVYRKKADDYRVEFRSPVDEWNSSKSNYIQVTVIGDKLYFQPTTKDQLAAYSNEIRKIVKLYKATDHLRIEDKGTHFKVTVSHQSDNGQPDGTECYEVDKKTLKSRMLWHEHPDAHSRGQEEPILKSRDGKPVEAVAEYIEVIE